MFVYFCNNGHFSSINLWFMQFCPWQPCECLVSCVNWCPFVCSHDPRREGASEQCYHRDTTHQCYHWDTTHQTSNYLTQDRRSGGNISPTSTHSHNTPGISDLAIILVRLAPNWTNSRLSLLN